LPLSRIKTVRDISALVAGLRAATVAKGTAISGASRTL
ncbi:hypothetical protein PSYMO_37511, partial [Pseudomonas amygdali pv. mori str. 301020]